MTSRFEQAQSVVLAVLMVLSMVAMGVTAAAAAGDSTIQDGRVDAVDETALDDTANSVSNAPAGETAEDVEIDRAVRDAAGTVEVVVRVEELPEGILAAQSDAGVLDDLQAHATESQRPVVEYAERTEGIELRNRFWISNAVLLRIDTSLVDVEELAGVNGVDSVHANFELETPDPIGEDAVDESFDTTYGLEQINAPDAWESFGTMGAGAEVAVLDTGVNPDHPDIDIHGDNWAEFDGEGDQIDSEPSDLHGHGTHTSGTVTGGDASGEYIGVAPDATLLHGKVLDDSGSATFAQLVGGMEWAVERAPDVMSMSLGTSDYNDEMIEPVRNAREAGVVVVTSSGNDGEGTSGSPGNVYESIAVGASDESEAIADFSSGEVVDTQNAWEEPPEEWPDEYVVPDVSAPGVGVLSADTTGGYTELDGTSMAAPHVAGAVALLRSANPGASPEEIQDALESTASKPADWDEPNDEKDVRYGAGIVDVPTAIQEVAYELGDVNQDREVGLTDAILVREHVADVMEEDVEFFEPAADVDRDGEIGLSDAILVREKVAGVLEEAHVQIDNVSAPDAVEGGETFEVTVDVENLGDEGARQALEVRLAQDESDLDEGTVVATDAVDMAPAGVDDPVGMPSEATVTFEINAAVVSDLPGGEFALGVFGDDDEMIDDITIDQPYFEVTALDDLEDVDQGQDVEIDATVTNLGNVDDTQDVEFWRQGQLEATAVEEDVSIDAGDSTNLTFELDTSGFDGGTHTYTVYTDDESETGSVYVNEPYFEVTDLDAPSTAHQNETYDVSATVRNTGDMAATQEIDYEFDIPSDVAVLDYLEDDENLRQGDIVVDVLDDQLPGYYDVELEDSQEALEHPELFAEEYDAIAVQRFGSWGSPGEIDGLEEFVDVMNDTDTGVVFLEQHGWASKSIDELNYTTGDPGVVNESEIEGIFGGESDVEDVAPDGLADIEPDGGENVTPDQVNHEIRITEDHDIFEGVGTEGDVVRTHSSYATPRYAWFDDYSAGDDLAEIRSDMTGDFHNVSAAVNDDADHVLLTLGIGSYTSYYTNDAQRILANSVAYAAGDDGGVGADTTDTVELEPGAETTVEFEYHVDEERAPDEYVHGIVSEDDAATETIDVEPAAKFEVQLFEAPTSILQGETSQGLPMITNTGTETATQEVEYVFGEDLDDVVGVEVVDSKEITLEPGETAFEEFARDPFAFDVPADHHPGEYEHGIRTETDTFELSLTIEELEPASFEAVSLDAPDRIEQGETIDVSATIENTGEAPGTHVVEYALGDEPVHDLNADVAVVNSEANQGEEIVGLLEGHLDSGQYDVEHVFDTDLLESPDEYVDQYDVFVLNEFDDFDHVDEPQEFEAFLDEADEANRGVIFLDTYGPYAFNIELLSEARDDPEAHDDSSLGQGPVDYHVEQDHAIFEEVASAGDAFEVRDDSWRSWFENYAGPTDGEYAPTLADAVARDEPEGQGPAVSVQANHVLLGSMGLQTELEDFSEDAERVLANSIEHLATATTAADQSETATRLTLEGGESETVEFSYTVPDDLLSGSYEHGVETEHLSAELASVDVVETDSDVRVTGHFLSDDEPSVGETLETTATVVNEGDATGERDIRFVFGGEVVDTETVELEPEEVTEVTLSTQVDEAGTFIASVNGVEPEQVTVGENVTAIAGAVADGNDLPVEGVHVVGDGAMEFNVTTDDEGEYFVEVEPGDYVVNVEDGDEYTANAVVSVEEGETAVQDFTVQTEPGQITGQVTDADTDEPIEGATVSDADGDAFEATTDENGTYTISDLDRGTYALQVEADGYQTSNLTFVDVDDSTEPVEQDFELAPITGQQLHITDSPDAVERGDDVEGYTGWMKATATFADALESIDGDDHSVAGGAGERNSLAAVGAPAL